MSNTRWDNDPSHPTSSSKVQHSMFTKLTGQFNTFDGTAETDGDNFTTSKVYFFADIGSLATNKEQRDAHLLHSDFFDAQTHPQLVFESDGLKEDR